MNDNQKKLQEKAGLDQSKSDPRKYSNSTHDVTWVSDKRAICDGTHLTGHNIDDRLKTMNDDK